MLVTPPPCGHPLYKQRGVCKALTINILRIILISNSRYLRRRILPPPTDLWTFVTFDEDKKSRPDDAKGLHRLTQNWLHCFARSCRQAECLCSGWQRGRSDSQKSVNSVSSVCQIKNTLWEKLCESPAWENKNTLREAWDINFYGNSRAIRGNLCLLFNTNDHKWPVNGHK